MLAFWLNLKTLAEVGGRIKVLSRVQMVGFTSDLPNGSQIELDPDGMPSIKGSTWELSPKERRQVSLRVRG